MIKWAFFAPRDLAVIAVIVLFVAWASKPLVAKIEGSSSNG